MISEDNIDQYIGKLNNLENDVLLKIHQVKQRNDGLWVIFEISNLGALPKRHTMTIGEFLDTFGQVLQID